MSPFNAGSGTRMLVTGSVNGTMQLLVAEIP